MSVRSAMPWPLRWAVAAIMLGFCGAIALWAFEFGRDIAGLENGGQAEMLQLRAQLPMALSWLLPQEMKMQMHVEYRLQVSLRP